eukprot:COSAG01_NODE_10551_length_2134_cov_2.284521_2_plen_385_part_00
MIITAQCGSARMRRANLLRYEFSLGAEVSHAEALISALGYQVLHCNGRRVAPRRKLEPGRTSAARVFFSRFDLGNLLRRGKNVLAVSLGNGWEVNAGNQPGAVQQPPALYLDANITLRSSSSVLDTAAAPAVVHLTSNSSWVSAAGRVVYDSVYQGERQDMRITKLGWANVGFDASDWVPAVVGGGSGKQLTEQTRPAVVELMALQPRSIQAINISHPSPHHRGVTCGSAEEDTPMLLTCPNSTIKSVQFAQYGTPTGGCPASGLKPGQCSLDLTPALTAACVGKESCTVECRSCGDTEGTTGVAASPPPPCANSCSVDGKTIVPSHDPCEGTKKTVVVAVSCIVHAPPPPTPKQHGFLLDFVSAVIAHSQWFSRSKKALVGVY